MMKNLLTTKQAAEYLSMSRQFLERDRWKGATIPYILVGERGVRYSVQHLDEYLASRVQLSHMKRLDSERMTDV